MEVLNPTPALAIRFWFSILWRSFFWGTTIAVGAGIILGVVYALAGFSAEMMEATNAVVTLLIGVPVSLYVAFSRIGKRVGNFRVIFVRDPKT